jgi:hypothetical protein
MVASVESEVRTVQRVSGSKWHQDILYDDMVILSEVDLVGVSECSTSRDAMSKQPALKFNLLYYGTGFAGSYNIEMSL